MSLSFVSQNRLATCHPLLQQLVSALAAKRDVLVICGFRDEQDQNQAFNTGKSSLPWPKSRHNRSPSEAVDLAPLPLDWNDTNGFRQLAEDVKATAADLGIFIEWGGDWASLKDLDHFQLKAGTF